MNRLSRKDTFAGFPLLMSILTLVLLVGGLFGQVQRAHAADENAELMVTGLVLTLQSAPQTSEPIPPTEPVASEISVDVDIDTSTEVDEPVLVIPSEYVTLYVASALVDCVGIVPQKCMQIRQDPNEEWQTFYSGIQGFSYESGYAYELRVRKEYVDTSTLADAPSVRYILEEIVSKEHVAEQTNQIAQLKLFKVAMPSSKQNFRFSGDLGQFQLDNPAVDDRDAVPTERSFALEPGQYTVTELVHKQWQLVEIRCVIDRDSANSYAWLNQQLILDIRDGGSIVCGFTSKHAGLIRVQNFDDKNADGRKNRKERGAANIIYSVYDNDGNLLDTNTTNAKGRLNFKVAVGSYKICQEQVDGLRNTLPGTMDEQLQQFCRTVTVKANTQVNIFFGNTTNSVTGAAVTLNDGLGVFIEELGDVADEDGGYAEVVADLADEETELFSHELFLPLVQR